MKSWESWGPDLIELVSLKEEMPENSLPLSPCSHIMWAHSQMAATYKPRQEASEWNLPRCFKSRRRCREVRWGDRLPPLPVYQKLTKIWNNSYRATFKQQQKTPGLQIGKLISLEQGRTKDKDIKKKKTKNRMKTTLILNFQPPRSWK